MLAGLGQVGLGQGVGLQRDRIAQRTRALALYASEGFVEEGRLRESVRVQVDGADGYDSLVVMSLLDREYAARVALGQEGG